MRRFVSMCLLLGLMVTLAGGDAVSEGEKEETKSPADTVMNWGKPKDFNPAKIMAFWVWHEDGLWLFRTTGGGQTAHLFAGQIEVVGGKLIEVSGQKGEGKGVKADRYVYSKTLIKFDFKTADATDGLNFKVDDDAKELKFTIAVDGQPASVKHIRIGNAGDHPPEGKFTLPAHPMDQKPAEAPKTKAKAKKK